MKNKLLLTLVFVALCGEFFAQTSTPYPCDQLSVDSVLSSRINPKQIQLNITNHDTLSTWGPTYFCLTNMAGDTIATDVTCGCVVLLRNRSGVFYMNANDSNFRVPPDFCCHLSLTGSGSVCRKEYNHCTTAGIATEALAQTSLSLFPNPSGGAFTVDLGSTPEAGTTVIVLNIQGQQLHTEMLYSKETTLNLGGCSAGIYFVQISSKGILRETKKLFIR